MGRFENKLPFPEPAAAAIFAPSEPSATAVDLVPVTIPETLAWADGLRKIASGEVRFIDQRIVLETLPRH